MWADNETAIDLLGFDVLVDELVVAITNPVLHPLTIGVLGTWGSGKSSLLAIAMDELESMKATPYACVAFSPWQHEDVDDIKTALMNAVLNKCAEIAPNDDVKEQVRRLRDRLPRFGRRARYLSTWAATAGPALVPTIAAVVDPSLGPDIVSAAQGITQAGANVASQALKSGQGQPEEDSEVSVAGVDEFRRELKAVLATLPVEAVVVFVDDLDRCLPDTVVDTFEALRLFLHTPSTAHVVAASRPVVEAAIDSRYPDLKREDGTGIGHDYLEKMLQLQVRVPSLSAAEIETYLNLLLSQLHLDDDERFATLLSDLRKMRADLHFPPAYNAATATKLLGDHMTTALGDDLAWATEISGLLASGLRGNPRELKRFLNDLTWRRRAAARRGVVLRPDVLAKLMVLEEQHPDDFQTLFDWQYSSDGPAPQLAIAEEIAHGERAASGASGSIEPTPTRVAKRTAKKATARPETDPVDKDGASRAGTEGDPEAEERTSNASDAAVESQVSLWAGRPRINAWLKLKPDLRYDDLRPYFSYFRDRLVVGSAASALDARQQELFARLINPTSLVSRGARDEMAALSEPDRTGRDRRSVPRRHAAATRQHGLRSSS